MRDYVKRNVHPGEPCIYAVLFARGPVPPNVTVLFTLHEGLWSE